MNRLVLRERLREPRSKDQHANGVLGRS